MNFKELLEEKKRELENKGIVKNRGEKKSFKDIFKLFKDFNKIKEGIK